MLIAYDEENDTNSPLPDPNIDLIPEPPDDPNPTQAQISLYSLSGHLAPETLRLLGSIASHQVVTWLMGVAPTTSSRNTGFTSWAFTLKLHLLSV